MFKLVIVDRTPEISCFFLAAMQKFHETKQPDEAVPEKAADSEPSESAKPGKDTTDEKEDESVDSRQSPVGESSEAEQGTGTPSVTDNCMFWSPVLL